MVVCMTCGATIAMARSGAWVHTEQPPDGTDPEHEIVVGARSDLDRYRAERGDLATALSELVVHHASVHPPSDCPFIERARAALRVG